MNKHDIIGALKSQCDTNSWHFLAGDNWYLNYGSDQLKYDNGDIVLIAMFNSKLTYSKARKLSRIEYTGFLGIGRKFEELPEIDPENPDAILPPQTMSGLNETFIQKYSNRLLNLTTELDEFISTFACANDLAISSCNIKYDLNKFNTNIDFTAATITLIDEL
jgi:hypothetical protein